ncbi:inorganic phosphate transporter [Verticillium dahliae VdLs.17]|uniref:Inorganic phosphate transporter n=1 Tax=Verticillium dahliae (strain VdLs.17 / ATCC MYA-4575 / FGSC 10137) TaxID=498257 RepID=G2WYY0_VERDV|nr:inorganic phosphate transporter [Verticillium dahliae VdLs.17]EGY21782.1 inorganic phosphate transporter [Verticillium dahliae VdLs.17]
MAELLRHQEHHDPRIGEIPVPHGPETGDEHDDFPREHTTEHERRIFAHITRPDDSYTPEGVYWADLPLRQRIAFVTKVDREEAASELKATGQMMKKDPLSPVGWYFRNAILPGAGLGLEGYVLFSIGNLEPLFHAVWPECWGSSGTACASNWVASVTYLEIVGIMIGQVVVGIIGDWIGRRWGLIQDALIMFVGLLMLTGSWAATLQGWVIFYAWSLFFYGLGVGGEYPITATSSMESAVAAGRLSTREDRLHRGRRVTMAFLMQGWGRRALLRVGRPVHLPHLLCLARHRHPVARLLPYLEDAPCQPPARPREAACRRLRHRLRRHRAARLLQQLWRPPARHRRYLVLHDVFFYGNKLFQGQFISVISSNPNSLMEKWTWNLINVVVSLAGYYLASLLIDNKLYGRKTMQQVGFFMCFIMFVIPAFNYDYYTSPAGIHAFQAMYFLSSFFNQFGPNSVTFLVAGEVFPTPVRASAHGFSACIGKAGALLASVLYNYIDTPTKFHVVPWFGLAGMLLTWGFLPDTTGLDLREQERRWMYIIQGREKEYHGVAVHPVHLSAWERMRGAGKEYNPDLDLKSQIRDLRTEWEEEQRGGNGEKAGGEEEAAGEGDWSPEIHGYFRQGQGKGKAVEGEEGRGVAETPGSPELKEKSAAA